MDNGYLTTAAITNFLLAHKIYISERTDYSLLFDLQKIRIDYSIQKKDLYSISICPCGI